MSSAVIGEARALLLMSRLRRILICIAKTRSNCFVEEMAPRQYPVTVSSVEQPTVGMVLMGILNGHRNAYSSCMYLVMGRLEWLQLDLMS